MLRPVWVCCSKTAHYERDDASAEVGTPSLQVLGDVNERAYGQFGVFTPLATTLRDPRICTHGLLDQGQFVCVALTMTLDHDLTIQYVATESTHRRQGLATRLLRALLTEAHLQGLETATLQASPDGLRVYERIGFRRVGTLRGYLIRDPTEPSSGN